MWPEREVRISHEFVEFIPDDLRERTLYISEEYGTAVHKCLCGCGREVVTPLSPTGWELTFDGRAVSLYPSVGNWCLPCRSHYVITDGVAVWAPVWTDEQVERGRQREARVRDRYYADADPAGASATVPKRPVQCPEPDPIPSRPGLLRKLIRWLFGR